MFTRNQGAKQNPRAAVHFCLFPHINLSSLPTHQMFTDPETYSCCNHHPPNFQIWPGNTQPSGLIQFFSCKSLHFHSIVALFELLMLEFWMLYDLIFQGLAVLSILCRVSSLTSRSCQHLQFQVCALTGPHMPSQPDSPPFRSHATSFAKRNLSWLSGNISAVPEAGPSTIKSSCFSRCNSKAIFSRDL